MPVIALDSGSDLFGQRGWFYLVGLKNGIPALNISLHIPETQGLQDTDKVFGRQRISAADIHGSQQSDESLCQCRSISSQPSPLSLVLCVTKLYSRLLHFLVGQQPNERFVVQIDHLNPVAPWVAEIAAERWN